MTLEHVTHMHSHLHFIWFILWRISYHSKQLKCLFIFTHATSGDLACLFTCLRDDVTDKYKYALMEYMKWISIENSQHERYWIKISIYSNYYLCTISMRTTRPSSWALSIMDFRSSGVPQRLLGAKKFVTWYLGHKES